MDTKWSQNRQTVTRSHNFLSFGSFAYWVLIVISNQIPSFSSVSQAPRAQWASELGAGHSQLQGTGISLLPWQCSPSPVSRHSPAGVPQPPLPRTEHPEVPLWLIICPWMCGCINCLCTLTQPTLQQPSGLSICLLTTSVPAQMI